MEYNHIAILLTENCNAHCKMCCDSRGEVCGHTLTIEELDIILKQIKEYLFAETVGLTGGEPMLYPALCEYIINYDYGRKMKFTIKTNGTIFKLS
ncbi:MAG: radical SAM protein [Lachnospiraceae bacterium]|nr:radical SAM protein [Lachnospiraceae bacterium]